MLLQENSLLWTQSFQIFFEKDKISYIILSSCVLSYRSSPNITSNIKQIQAN